MLVFIPLTGFLRGIQAASPGVRAPERSGTEAGNERCLPEAHHSAAMRHCLRHVRAVGAHQDPSVQV